MAFPSFPRHSPEKRPNEARSIYEVVFSLGKPLHHSLIPFPFLLWSQTQKESIRHPDILATNRRTRTSFCGWLSFARPASTTENDENKASIQGCGQTRFYQPVSPRRARPFWFPCLGMHRFGDHPEAPEGRNNSRNSFRYIRK